MRPARKSSNYYIVKVGRIFVEIRPSPSSSSRYKAIQHWLTFNFPWRAWASISCAPSTTFAEKGMRRLTQPPRMRCEKQFNENLLIKQREYRSKSCINLRTRKIWYNTVPILQLLVYWSFFSWITASTTRLVLSSNGWWVMHRAACQCFSSTNETLSYPSSWFYITTMG